MKKINLMIILLLIFTTNMIYTQEIPALEKNNWILEALPPSAGLGGNGIVDLAIQEFPDSSIIWAGTGGGLSRMHADSIHWETYTTDNGLGKGSVSALTIRDNEIWIATSFDSMTSFGSQWTGGGISFSLDGGLTWAHTPQPGETPIQNVSWDIALLDSTVWITSWGGGLRKTTDRGQNWRLVTPDSFTFNPVEIFNHNSWSVINADDVLWVGTAGGINKSLDNGKTWVNFTHQNQDHPISGNWVRAIAYQKYENKNVIWAACWIASTEEEDPTEFNGVSKSEDQGYTWTSYLAGERIYSIAFDENIVYATGENGLFKSVDDGQTWAKFPAIRDTEHDLAIYSSEYYTAAVSADHSLWVGTADGLAKTSDDGLSWRIFRSIVRTGVNNEPRTYAYPNPFSPMRFNNLAGTGHVRIQYNTTASTSITIKVYDFALDHVRTLVTAKPRFVGDFHEVWDGKNDRNEQVANGVYFYSVEIANDGTHWGKIIVLD